MDRRLPVRVLAARLAEGLAGAVVVLSVLAWFASVWYRHRFGDTGFDSILFTILFDVEKAESGQFRSFLLEALLPGAVALLALAAFLEPRWRSRIDLVARRSGRRIRLWPLPAPVSAAAYLAVAAACLAGASRNTGFRKWLAARTEKTALYAERYVDPKGVAIAFPEKKRNLVCIYVESAETTFFSRAQGGALPVCAVPELYRLAADNVNFSHHGGVGGWPRTTGTSWTVGAMVALTMGVPFEVPVHGNAYGKHAAFLPGAWALGDALHAAGYRQALIVGSDASFGGRDKLYGQHGTDEILDVSTAPRDGVVPEGYHKWWGFEDAVLFEYAKLELARLAADGRPFALTLLTADTHATGGFVCDRCRNDFVRKYENVFACTSRQVAAFVDWLRSQPYWNDTTLLVCGDHLGHDHRYFRDALAGFPCDRRVYNCFLNAVPPAPPERTKNRVFSPMDMYPTVLAAMGCTIPGERLGLGTNLFSGEPTLAEELGTAGLNAEIEKRSDEYLFKLVLGR